MYDAFLARGERKATADVSQQIASISDCCFPIYLPSTTALFLSKHKKNKRLLKTKLKDAIFSIFVVFI